MEVCTLPKAQYRPSVQKWLRLRSICSRGVLASSWDTAPSPPGDVHRSSTTREQGRGCRDPGLAGQCQFSEACLEDLPMMHISEAEQDQAQIHSINLLGSVSVLSAAGQGAATERFSVRAISPEKHQCLQMKTSREKDRFC